jgi:hypothetical protein
MRQATRSVSSALVFVGWSLVGACPDALAAADPYDEAVGRALALLPRRPDKIVLLDIETASPAMREKLGRVEGFVTTGEPTVYLKKQGVALQQASKGPGVFDYVVAIKIWHEMAHIAGADELEAQRQEEELWKEFIVSQKVDSRRGLAYLELLSKRHAPDSGRTATSPLARRSGIRWPASADGNDVRPIVAGGSSILRAPATESHPS